MTYVGSSWTEIGRNTDTSHGGTIKIRCIAYSEQNISNNTSVIHFQWQKAWDDASSAYTIYWNDAHAYSITTSGHSADMNFALGSLVGANPDDWHDIGSDDYWGSISHNADGSCSLSFNANGYRYFDTFSFSGTIELPTIPRTSNVSLNKSTVTLNGSDGFVIYTNRASSSFSHNLYQNISGSWVQIAGGVGDNYTWIPSTDFYANIGNGSGTYQILCKTYSGSTHIGDSQVNFTINSAGVHQSSLNTSSITLNGSNGVRIYTKRNSGSFLHYIQQNFSDTLVGINSAYDVTDYLDWTPPLDYYNTIGSGSKTFTIRVHCQNNNGTYLGYTDCSFTIYSAGADAVSISPSTSMTMGTAYTVSIAKKISSFTHTVTWAFGTASGQLGTDKAVDTSVSWTPVTDLSSQIPTSMTGTGTVACQTFYGSTPIGSTAVTFNLSVPTYNVILGTPTITEEGVNNSTDKTALTTYGIENTEVVATMSVKRLVVKATTSYNATIKNIIVSFGGKTLDTLDNTDKSSFNNIFSEMTNGTLTITATDTRERTLSATYSKSYTFRNYFLPTISEFKGDRTETTATISSNGSFWNGTAGTTTNSVTAKITGASTGTPTLTKSNNTWSTSYALSGIISTSSYDFTITLIDSFNNKATKNYTLQIYEAVMWKGKHTVRIHRFLIVDRIIKTAKGVFTESVTAPTFIGSLQGNADTATSANSIPLEKYYPIGAIYMSVDNTSPASLFGGSWTALPDRFLLGAGNTYDVNTTGGEVTHTLTISEMPNHTHERFRAADGTDWVYFATSETSHGRTVTAKIPGNQTMGATGNDGAHNNMPPYLAVYMWKRVS